MDAEHVVDEISKLLQAKDESEQSVARRGSQIKGIWISLAILFVGWIVTGTLWYAKMDRTARAVDLIYESYFGHKLP